jgi:negative regulator of flagellin synthesis FlgM
VKIEDLLKGVPAIRSREARKSKAGEPGLTTGGGAAGDSVEITRTSASLNMLAEELMQLDSSGSSKVEAVRQAIADGSYQVDEEAVADALVKNTMEQLRRQGRIK